MTSMNIAIEVALFGQRVRLTQPGVMHGNPHAQSDTPERMARYCERQDAPVEGSLSLFPSPATPL